MLHAGLRAFITTECAAHAAPAQLRRSSIGTAYPPDASRLSARTITLRDNVLFEERNLSAADLERNRNPHLGNDIVAPVSLAFGYGFRLTINPARNFPFTVVGRLHETEHIS